MKTFLPIPQSKYQMMYNNSEAEKQEQLLIKNLTMLKQLKRKCKLKIFKSDQILRLEWQMMNALLTRIGNRY